MIGACSYRYSSVRSEVQDEPRRARARDADLHHLAARLLGVAENVVAVLHFANPEAAKGSTAANLSLVFLATRVAHPILYLANLDILRSVVFLIGLVCGFSLLWIA